LDRLIIHVNTHRSECQSIVILVNLLFEPPRILRIIKQILKNTWPLVNDRKMNLTLKTAHAKVRCTNPRVGELFRNKVKGMTIRALDIQGSQRMKLNRLSI
jgi:hypothetical protein